MCDIGEALGLTDKPKAVKLPKPVIPAPPAPQRKQDTGAIVAVGDTDSEYTDERKRRASRISTRQGGSSLGELGSGAPLL